MSPSRSASVASGVALRATRKLIGAPGGMVAQMLIPLFFFLAFTGALSAVGSTKGFGYYNYTAFVFVFVMYQAAIFAGVFTAIEIAIDFGSGIGNRFMLSAPRRMAIIVGYLIFALGRAGLAIAVVWGIALAIGMPVRADVLEVAGLVVLALLLCLAATLYGAGIALRFRSAASAVLIMIPTFMVMFVAPVFVPRGHLSGWLKATAGVNPLTPPLEAGRGLLADNPFHTGLAVAAAGGLVIAFSLWAVRGMHKAEQGPGAARRLGPPGPGGRGGRGGRGPSASNQSANWG